MKNILNISSGPARLSGAILALSLLSAPVWGGIREDALSEVSRLHQSDKLSAASDEVKSVDEALRTAENYFQSNRPELSEQYYILALQKARVIMASVSNLDTAAPIPSSPAIEKKLQAAPDGASVEGQPVVRQEPATGDAVSQSQEPGQQTPPVEQDDAIDGISSDKLVGRSSTYTVVGGDTIRLVAAKLGVSRQHILSMNKLDAKSYLKTGQQLRYNNRKIIPQQMKEGIVVNIPDRTLYLFKKGKLAVSVPVALGVAVKTSKYDWKTPTGKFKITAKAKDPTWYVPPSIQSEMEEQGKEVITSIPPGPSNPLGKYAFKTSIPGILIHSTIKPWSIYSYASHGCIRVYPSQMEELFKEVSVNTPGEIIYKPVKLAVTEEGRVFLEVHNDVYGKSAGLAKEARLQIEKLNLTERVDWKKVDSVLKHKTGIAEDISL